MFGTLLAIAKTVATNVAVQVVNDAVIEKAMKKHPSTVEKAMRNLAKDPENAITDTLTDVLIDRLRRPQKDIEGDEQEVADYNTKYKARRRRR